MPTWAWIVAAVLAIPVLGLLGIFVWDYLNRPGGLVFDWRTSRKVKREIAGMSDEELAAAASEARSRKAQWLAARGGSASMMGIAELTQTSDVRALIDVFSRSDSWQIRELVTVALGNICRDSRVNVDYRGTVMLSALRSVIDLCNAETSGGSYRTNCLDHARMLLQRHGQPPSP